jgi:hypothetical protein
VPVRKRPGVDGANEPRAPGGSANVEDKSQIAAKGFRGLAETPGGPSQRKDGCSERTGVMTARPTRRRERVESWVRVDAAGPRPRGSRLPPGSGSG